jgi:hypothetical protein
MATNPARRRPKDSDAVAEAELVRLLDAGGPLPDTVDDAAVDRAFQTVLRRIDRRADQIEATLRQVGSARK